MKVIAIDNGTSGSISIVDDTNKLIFHDATPVIETINYTKTLQKIKRIDVRKLDNIIKEYKPDFAILERPMVNPKRFKNSLLAVRAFEATLNVLELNHIPYEIIDSKEWQRAMLPQGTSKEDLKFVADEKAKQLFGLQEIKKGFGDSLLMAKYYFHKNAKK